MTWFDRLLKGSKDRSNLEDFQISPVQLPSRDYADKGIQEQQDQAIALSLALAEEETLERISQLEADEEFARGLQASLDLEVASPTGAADQVGPTRGHRVGPSPSRGLSTLQHLLPRFSNIKCLGCQRDIGIERFLTCMNGYWHPQCFRCGHCKFQINDPEFAVRNNKPYHTHCHKELFHPRCQVCSIFIPKNAAQLIEFRSHPYWGQQYCPAHENDGTARCCSCERLEPRDLEFISYDDGRKLCLDCLDTCIIDTKECQPLIREVLAFFDNLGMTIKQQIPILLVEMQALNDAGELEGKCKTSQTRGLCLSEEQTISTVSFRRMPRLLGSKNPFSGKGTESLKLRRECSVTAVLVLYGLPRLLTGSILAHELMHAWFRLNGDGSFSSLSPVVEEGMCQVMAHEWLRSQLGNNEPSSSATRSAAQIDTLPRLGRFYLNQIQLDSSPSYGEGFRRGQQAVTKYGLDATLEHIRLTATFPE